MRLARLDGIRGVAVLLVICMHHSLLVEIGWTGVDLFFVLSGFLITGILIRGRSEPAYWRTFYIKRAVRIVPPLLILLLATTVLFRHLSMTGLAGYVLFMGDFVNVSHYSIAPLIGLWSLAIEEHFYIVWPFATRFMQVRKMVVCLIVIICLEPVARIAGGLLHVPSETIYYLTVFRLDGLCAGALLAIVEVTGARTPIVRRAAGVIAASATTLLVVLTYMIPSFTRTAGSVLFNGFGYSLVTCAACATVAHVLWEERSLASRILSNPVIVFIGRISYGMYLYHFVVLSLGRHLLKVPAGAAGTAGTQLLAIPDILITIGISYISFRFYEQPIMDWGKRKLRSERMNSSVQMKSTAVNAA